MTTATFAHEQMGPMPEARLIPVAGRAGYVPVTGLGWLEVPRQRHEVLAEQLADAVVVPKRVREDHDAAVAAWRDEVRAAARTGEVPPERGERLSPAWLAGQVDVAEAAIVAIVDELLRVLRDAEAAFVEHEAEIDELVAQLDDGFGGALVSAERAAAGDPPLPPSPLLSGASAVKRWRSMKSVGGRAAVAVDLQELENYPRRRQERRPEQEQ